MEMSLRVLSDEVVRDRFGDPSSRIGADGTVDRGWEIQILDWVQLPAPLRLSFDLTRSVERFRCHKLVRPFFQAAFNQLFNDPEAWNSIGDFGGCYLFRNVRGKKALSRHSWGIAIDMDVLDNPFLGVVPRVNPRVKEVMEIHGFVWGGATVWGGAFPWGRRDAQHWEFAAVDRL
jgi:hypothetical protein